MLILLFIVRSQLEKKMSEVEDIVQMIHLPYIPELAPSAYHFFRSVPYFLRRKHFHHIHGVELGVQDFLASKLKEFFRQGIQDMA